MRRLAAGLLVAALVASGCGDDGEEAEEVPADEWAGSVCGAFLDFAGRTATFVEEFGSLDELSLDDLVGSVGLLDAIGQELGAMEAELAELGDDLEASGVPDVSDGDEAVAAVTETFDEVRAHLQAAVDLIAELSPEDLAGDGLAGLRASAEDIAASLGSLGDDLEADLPATAQEALATQASCAEADELLRSVEESFVPG